MYYNGSQWSTSYEIKWNRQYLFLINEQEVILYSVYNKSRTI